jgi:hypothetical protein
VCVDKHDENNAIQKIVLLENISENHRKFWKLSLKSNDYYIKSVQTDGRSAQDSPRPHSRSLQKT